MSETVELRQKKSNGNSKIKEQAETLRVKIGEFLIDNVDDIQEVYEKVKESNPAEALRFYKEMAKVHLPAQQAVQIDDTRDKAKDAWFMKIKQSAKSQEEN